MDPKSYVNCIEFEGIRFVDFGSLIIWSRLSLKVYSIASLQVLLVSLLQRSLLCRNVPVCSYLFNFFKVGAS
jgi:hypothetical protein